MYAQIHDPNLHGYIEFEDFDTPAELQMILHEHAGLWWRLPDSHSVLLSDPCAWVYELRPVIEGDAYPDYIVTTRTVEMA